MIGTSFFKSQTLRLALVLAAFAAPTGSVFAQPALQNPQLGQSTPRARANHDRPVERGYIIPSATEVPGGVEISVEIFHKTKNAPVSLFLQAAVNDGTGKLQVIPIEVLSDHVRDNRTNYYSNRVFKFTYAELNRKLAKLAPNAKNMKIGPGSPLFVYAQFHLGPAAGQSYHQWGGVSRGGIVYMPGAPQSAGNSLAAQSRPTELDLAFPITQTLANQFNNARNNHGLQVGGQIRSRVEAEGKFQVALDDFNTIRKQLFKMANDPAEAAKVLGPGWTFKLEDRYMVRDKAGNLKLDKDGFPIPDPMVDTYYDNKSFDAAQNDMATRYRWTKGNNTGSWNFKPGMAAPTREGVVYRTEYAVDTTDDKPGTIKEFADSTHPLNIFNAIRDVVPGAKPSEFFVPSVEITDFRYKFKMQHKNGLVVELSLDDVRAKSLRAKGRKSPVRFAQLEMDIDHLATTSTNIARNAGVGMGLMHSDPASIKTWLTGLGSRAFLDGRPVLHNQSDLDPSSPIRQAHGAEFKLAARAIESLRDDLLGKDWLPGAQKYAYATTVLNMVDPSSASQSVKELLAEQAKLERAKRAGTLSANKCQLFFKR